MTWWCWRSALPRRRGCRSWPASWAWSLNDYGFAADATATTRPAQPQPGVFVAGAFREPKDIPETVAEAAGAAAEVAAFLHGGA